MLLVIGTYQTWLGIVEQGSSCSSSQKPVDHRWAKEYVQAVKETLFDQSNPSGSEGPEADKAKDR